MRKTGSVVFDGARCAKDRNWWLEGRECPGDPANPMKVVKIFFKEPDYYIHGTGDVESIGLAEHHMAACASTPTKSWKSANG